MSNTAEYGAPLRVPTFEPFESYGFEEYAHALGETVRSQDRELAGLAEDHRRMAATHTAQYRQFLTQASSSEASELFYAMAGTVADDVAYAETRVQRTIYTGANDLERMLSGDDFDVLQQTRRAVSEHGFGSAQYHDVIGRASCRAAHQAIQRIMDWPLLGKLRTDSDKEGAGSSAVRRDIRLASPGARDAFEIAHDSNVFNAVHDAVAVRFEDGGFGTRPRVDWHEVDWLVSKATPSMRPTILATLDLHVEALATHTMVSPFGVNDDVMRRHLRRASSVESKLLIAKSVGWPETQYTPRAYESQQYYSPYAPYANPAEPGPVRRVSNRVLAAAAGLAVGLAAVFAGVAVAERQSGGAKRAAAVAEGNIVPCFSSVEKLPMPSSEPHKLNVPVVSGYAEGSGPAPDSVANQVAGEIVEITASDWKGTGVITTDAYGRQVVITAAHVVGTESPGDLTITTQDGRQVHPTGGCYIYGRNGNKMKLENPSAGEEKKNLPIPDSDLAVLGLASPLTSHPMPIADAEPAAGHVVDFVNYQSAYGPDNSLFSDDLYTDPAAYEGIVAPTGDIDGPDLSVITGAQNMGPSPTNGEFQAIHIEGGASGGPVVTVANGIVKLIGISTAGTKDGVSFSPSDISTLWYTNFRGADSSQNAGFDPTVATVMPVSLINRALGAGVLKTAASQG